MQQRKRRQTFQHYLLSEQQMCCFLWVLLSAWCSLVHNSNDSWNKTSRTIYGIHLVDSAVLDTFGYWLTAGKWSGPLLCATIQLWLAMTRSLHWSRLWPIYQHALQQHSGECVYYVWWMCILCHRSGWMLGSQEHLSHHRAAMAWWSIIQPSTGSCWRILEGAAAPCYANVSPLCPMSESSLCYIFSGCVVPAS